MPAYKYTLTDGTRATVIDSETVLANVLDGLYLKFGADRVARVESMDGLEVLEFIPENEIQELPTAEAIH